MRYTSSAKKKLSAKNRLFTLLLAAGGLLTAAPTPALAAPGEAAALHSGNAATRCAEPVMTAPRRATMQAVCATPTLTTNTAAFRGDYIIGACAATDTLYYAFGSAPDLSDEDCARVTDGSGTPIAGGGNISLSGMSDGTVLYLWIMSLHLYAAQY